MGCDLLSMGKLLSGESSGWKPCYLRQLRPRKPTEPGYPTYSRGLSLSRWRGTTFLLSVNATQVGGIASDLQSSLT